MNKNYIFFIVIDTWDLLPFYSNMKLLICHHIYQKTIYLKMIDRIWRCSIFQKWCENLFLIHPNTWSSLTTLLEALYCNFRLLNYILVSYYLRILEMCLIFIIIRKYGVSNTIVLVVSTKNTKACLSFNTFDIFIIPSNRSLIWIAFYLKIV